MAAMVGQVHRRAKRLLQIDGAEGGEVDIRRGAGIGNGRGGRWRFHQHVAGAIARALPTGAGAKSDQRADRQPSHARMRHLPNSPDHE